VEPGEQPGQLDRAAPLGGGRVVRRRDADRGPDLVVVGSRCSSVMVGVFVIRFGVRLRICWSNFALISVK
jgi:hypothetical protein